MIVLKIVFFTLLLYMLCNIMTHRELTPGQPKAYNVAIGCIMDFIAMLIVGLLLYYSHLVQ
jgi:hypothetical protein